MVSPAFPLAALVLGLGAEATILFTGFAVLTLLRWIGRATAYLHGRAMSVLVSDLTYALLLAAALALVWLKGAVSLTASFAAMAAAALLALLPFGFRFAATIFRGVGKRPLRSFIEMARTRLPWSMLDVFCTEVTDHSHAYIVTLFAGTAGYAPLAATGQLVRPMTVVSNALSDMERPRFAQLRTEGRLADLYRSMRTMRIALALAWLAASSAVLALFVAGPYRLFPPSYDIEVLVVGASFWVLISGLAIARVPEGSHLQAVGSFRATAAAQLYGAITSVAAVILLLLVAGPVWSLAGTFLGRAVNAARLQAISRRWRRENAGPAAAPEAAIA
jgi:O-antigen/teichoic acid export membrane protein